MSEVKVNKISPRSGTDVTLGDSGDTFTVPSGATIVNSGTATGFASGLASVQTFTSSGTWTRPAGITKVIMEVQGAGGGGGRNDTYNYRGTSGSAGGYAKKLLDVSSVASSTITIGAGGAGGAADTNDGAAGGLSSWADGGTTVTGGAGGAGLGEDSYGYTAGGSGTNGDINITGGPGGCGRYGSGAPDSQLGVGGNYSATAVYQDTGENDGVGYGSGGGGSDGQRGGNGAGGIIIVWEYK